LQLRPRAPEPRTELQAQRAQIADALAVWAQAVRYVPERDAIEIVTNRNAGFLIPRQWIGVLQDVPTAELDRLEVWPDRFEDHRHTLREPRRASDFTCKAAQLASQRSQRRSTPKENSDRVTSAIQLSHGQGA